MTAAGMLRTGMMGVMAALLLAAMEAGGQQRHAPVPVRKPVSAEVPVDAYIQQAWQTLRRSMNECGSLVDPKVKTRPVLYLPANLPEPAEVAALPKACGVQVERLPVKIAQMGQKLPPLQPGLLYLPNAYVVPGGRFNEMYGWDSYFMILGLTTPASENAGKPNAGAERTELARGIVENFFFEIEHYGGILNANRTYYLTRSQPPFLSSMIRAVWEAEAGAGQQQEADAWLKRAYEFAQRDHAFWMRPEMRAGDTGLQRYWDYGSGPVPEMGDDPTYYRTVIRWLLAHPAAQTGYLVDGPAEPARADWRKIAATSCDPATSQICSREHVGTHWLTREFYQGDRAMRESGFDTTFRFGPYGGSTQDYAPVGLNALLFKYEMDLAWMARELGHPDEAKQWETEASARRAAMDRHLWNAQRGMYFDYDFVTGKGSSYDFLTTFYPLWAGAASAEQARKVEENLGLFEKPGGPAVSTTASGEQWDLPYGWAPTTWLAADGMARYGDMRDALRVAQAFTTTVRNSYLRTGTIREKYNVVTGSPEFQVLAGYRQNVVGFGWTNAVYERLEQMLRGPGVSMPRPRGGPVKAIPVPRR